MTISCVLKFALEVHYQTITSAWGGGGGLFSSSSSCQGLGCARALQAAVMCVWNVVMASAQSVED